MEAIRRVEELTYQVEALTRENTKLRVQVCDTREEASRVAEDLLASQAEVSSLNAQIEAMFGRAFLRRNADRLNTVRNGNRREFSRSECERVRYGESVAGMVARIEAQYFDKLKKIG